MSRYREPYGAIPPHSLRLLSVVIQLRFVVLAVRGLSCTVGTPDSWPTPDRLLIHPDRPGVAHDSPVTRWRNPPAPSPSRIVEDSSRHDDL